MSALKVIFLVGATAVGKTRVGVFLAKQLNAEVISCDSMQVYKGMSVLSSQPTAALRRQVRHHLIGTVSPQKEYDVFHYRQDALRLVKQLIARGKTPLFVGGSGHYLSILLDGIFEARIRNKTIRQRLYRQAEKKGNRYLYSRLKSVDPLAASKIHPHDTRRIVRALEVYQAVGRPISELQQQRKGLADEYSVRIFCLDLPREELYQRINRRVEGMFRQGLIREVKKLLKAGLSRTAQYAIGIAEIKEYLEARCSLAAARELIKRRSRQYAKRQLSWFRNDKRIQWLQLGKAESAQAIAQRIIRAKEYDGTRVTGNY